MDSASYIAAAGMKTCYRALDVVTNNLANVNSPGFKAERPFYRMLQEARGLSGSALYGTVTDFGPGTLRSTGNPLDLAINGEGFFTVLTPGGERYTRNGSFSIAQGGELVTREGLTVQGVGGGPIIIALGPDSPNEVTVSPSGDVSVDGELVGTLAVVSFADYGSLRSEGSLTFASDVQPQRVVNPNIEQGVLEESNVDAIGALLQLIQLNRAFDINQRTVFTLMNTVNRRAVNEIAAQ